MKKIFLAIFVLSFVAMPAVSNAGFFDFLRGERNQAAQVRTSVSATADSGTYIEGDRNDTIKRIQALLKSKNLYRGSVSGIFGPQTKAAIMAYQKSNGLTVTGVLDTATINSILGRGSNNERGGGTTTASTAPTLSYLQGRCNGNTPAFVRIVSPWAGDQYVYGQDDIPLKIFVCDATGSTGTDYQIGVLSEEIDPITNSVIGPVTLFTVFDEGDMTPYQTNTWTIDYTIDSEEFDPGFYALMFGNSGYYIDGVVQQGQNVYHGAGPFEVVNQLGGGGNCDEDDIELSILPTTPFGVQTNTNDFPVLEFKIENPTNCNVQLDNMEFIYMVTDTLPYFEDLTLREKDTMLNVGTGEANTGISGEFLDLGFGQNGYIINAGDEQDFLLVLEVYNQPTQGQLPFNEFINKSMIFGLPKLNSLNFRFTTDMFPHVIQLPVNAWGKVVQLPLS